MFSFILHTAKVSNPYAYNFAANNSCERQKLLKGQLAKHWILNLGDRLDGDHYHIETSPLICGANQWTGFYMIAAFVMKGLKISRLSLMILTGLGCRNLVKL